MCLVVCYGLMLACFRLVVRVVRVRSPHRMSAYGVTRTFQEVRVFEQMTVLDNVLVVLAGRSVFASLFRRV